jgi:hypothetical protein
MLVFTSVTKSYLPKARVLAKSIKRFHPDWTFVLRSSQLSNLDCQTGKHGHLVILLSNFALP